MEIKDLAGLSEPSSKLIEVVSKAVGTIYEPTRIRREAKALADALITKTKAEIEVEEIRYRAANRLVAQEIKKQENIESVARQAAAMVHTMPATDQAIDEDWLNRFILDAQEVSDARLQTVWAKLLAGEFQSPGAFPRRVFRLIKDFEPKDAELIDSLADKLLWVENHDGSSCAFLNSHIFEEWILVGRHEDRKLLGATLIKHADYLKELGVIDQQDYSFRFSVEGPLRPDSIHMSSVSVKRIYSGSLEINPEHIQPNFVRTKGPSVSPAGVPQINQWTKEIEFDAWKVTFLGASVFAIAAKQPDSAHFASIREFLVGAGMKLKTS